MVKPSKTNELKQNQIEESSASTPEASLPTTAEANLSQVEEQPPISGRGVFAVSRVEVGVAVQTAFLADDGRLLQMPAVFPNLEYALQQVDEMRQMVINQFSLAQ